MEKAKKKESGANGKAEENCGKGEFSKHFRGGINNPAEQKEFGSGHMIETAEAICAFIKRKVERAGAEGVVLGVSGGVDSACVAALCAKALGKENVFGIIMPDKATSSKESEDDGAAIAGMFCGNVRKVDISHACDALAKSIPDFAQGALIPNGNLRARTRMMTLYYYANKFGLLVAGTGDKSEIALGYFTKYGDGGVDFLPIGGLYKTQVRALAEFLGVPPSVAQKEPSPGLWEGHTAKQELGVGYDEIDVLLAHLEGGASVPDAANAAGIDAEAAKKIARMIESSGHKREMPDICPV